MGSFMQKLTTKLNEVGAPMAQGSQPVASPANNAGGVRTSPPAQQPGGTPASGQPAQPPVDVIPEGVQSLAVDLFQSDARMVIFAQMPGVAMEGFDLTADEESNTLVIQATQKRPDMPPVPGVKKDAPPEKGRFAKQETTWVSLYRKVYLPAPFDIADTDAFLTKGVLVVVLPVKQPGAGKKLSVKEIPDEKHQEQS